MLFNIKKELLFQFTTSLTICMQFWDISAWTYANYYKHLLWTAPWTNLANNAYFINCYPFHDIGLFKWLESIVLVCRKVQQNKSNSKNEKYAGPLTKVNFLGENIRPLKTLALFDLNWCYLQTNSKRKFLKIPS
mgnify:CR=1 FL=1